MVDIYFLAAVMSGNLIVSLATAFQLMRHQNGSLLLSFYGLIFKSLFFKFENEYVKQVDQEYRWYK